MPGKHVRFDGIPPTPVPSLPSLTNSSYSPSSVADLNTPPPLKYHGSPNACSPLPYVPSAIHDLLGVAQVGAPPIHCDLTLEPSLSTVGLNPKYHLHPHALYEPATTPPLGRMVIDCTHLLKPAWAMIEVWATNPNVGVTVMDVLHAIYRALRTGTTGDDFNALAYHDQKKVNDAYQRRVKLFRGDKAIERAKGVKRIDYLKEKHLFGGLVETKSGPDIWRLVLA
ncbi:hypothetical protein DXG03_004674 [Asterophora parasitica]|uniref:DUF6699 domain-containing protein n=1 Tax=Asterophora parasitica TaxID=117018 RepID=A0A9P7K7S3_9AGAR|nr:hypothetical protein DXG03_004674 [Asterophora parasitica]